MPEQYGEFGELRAGTWRFNEPAILTIASGVITVTSSFHTVRSETAFVDDDLTTINCHDPTRQLLILQASTTSGDITLKTTGNVYTPYGLDMKIIALGAPVIGVFEPLTARWCFTGMAEWTLVRVLNAGNNATGLHGWNIANWGYQDWRDCTVASGVLTLTTAMQIVGGEGNAADNLDTVTSDVIYAAVTEGVGIFYLRPQDASGETITIRSGAGNITCWNATNIVMSRASDMVMLFYDFTADTAFAYKLGDGGVVDHLADTTAVHAMTSMGAGNWKVFYSNGSGVVTELVAGAAGKVLYFNGTAAAPTAETAYAYRTYLFYPSVASDVAITTGDQQMLTLSGPVEETVLQVDSHFVTTGTAITFEIEQAAGRVLDSVSWSNLTGDITHTAATHALSLETTSFTDSTIGAGYKLLRLNISAVTGTWKNGVIIMTTRSLIPIA